MKDLLKPNLIYPKVFVPRIAITNLDCALRSESPRPVRLPLPSHASPYSDVFRTISVCGDCILLYPRTVVNKDMKTSFPLVSSGIKILAPFRSRLAGGLIDEAIADDETCVLADLRLFAT